MFYIKQHWKIDKIEGDKREKEWYKKVYIEKKKHMWKYYSHRKKILIPSYLVDMLVYSD